MTDTSERGFGHWSGWCQSLLYFRNGFS